MSQTKRLPQRALLEYGAVALPLAFAGLPFYIHAPDFYMRIHGVALATMGSVLLGVRLVDAVQDPLIGRLSDVFAHARVAIILTALLILGLGFALLYNPPSGISPIVWFMGSMVLSTAAFSTIAINLNALGSLWSRDPAEKTRIATAREGLGLVGLLVATLLPTVLQLSYSPQFSFQIYAGLFLALICFTSVTFAHWGRAHKDVIASKTLLEPFSVKKIAELFKAPFRTFFAAYGLSMLSSSIPGILVLLFVRDRLNAEKLTGVFLILYFMAGVVGMPLWRKISVHFGKEQTWLIAMVLAVVTFIGASRLGSGDVVAYGLICFLSGLALGAELVLPSSIISDFIDRQRLENETSSLFAIMHFLNKLALALASGFAFLLLGWLGYKVNAAPSAAGLTSLSFIYAVLPCALKAIAALFVWKLINQQRSKENA